MTQATLTNSTIDTVQALVDSEPFYPQCYLYQPDEVQRERNLMKVEMALFITGVSHEAAHQASMIITRIKPGYIVSGSEYRAIHQALGEIGSNVHR